MKLDRSCRTVYNHSLINQLPTPVHTSKNKKKTVDRHIFDVELITQWWYIISKPWREEKKKEAEDAASKRNEKNGGERIRRRRRNSRKRQNLF